MCARGRQPYVGKPGICGTQGNEEYLGLYRSERSEAGGELSVQSGTAEASASTPPVVLVEAGAGKSTLVMLAAASLLASQSSRSVKRLQGTIDSPRTHSSFV
jgi:hypothetical protein